ncbi:MAG: type II toxin-antitoxin system HicB family antitoxin [Vicinamibacteria bacterium]|nr:type II toxin-antitoxin system HicB family antitoxin [Vicinamibacteria bacterium]
MYRITLRIERLEEGPYLGTSPDLPGLLVQADTADKLVALAPSIARDFIAVMIETGQELPPTLTPIEPPPSLPILVPA